ncbi:MAG TPA: hypothetical protein H9981_07370 [Candidatus Mediterraneibacter caccavium]|uniref:Uncharacterized protein n=1 Tax=Candidatus Mediterraneibacter caccavium TaxID=2838661 RepID=A0A9D1VXU9_9FIRM|nr:hypothetical protein [Candidatus Mediterraneibacter caccavium]
MAEPYLKEIDFAFFAVNFGYSKADYEALTQREKAFIYKAWENKNVSDTTFIYNAVFTATYNVNRKKNKRALKLWRKALVRKADKEVIHDNLKIILEVEEKEGKSWITQIYRENGLPAPRKEGGG